MIMKAIGVKANICASQMPSSPEPARGREMPKAPRNWLTRPARPNSRIRPRPTTKGGVMMAAAPARSDVQRFAQRPRRAALGHQREQRASTVVPRRSAAPEQRVPGHAAAHAAGQQRQAQTRSCASRVASAAARRRRFVDEGAPPGCPHRQRDEQQQRAFAQHHRAGDEQVAAKTQPRCRRPAASAAPAGAPAPT